MRHVLVGQDLSGQTIEGEPFSYLGRCTGTDIKFIGDWQFASLWANDFTHPDWSKARTHRMYSISNTLVDPVLPPDLDDSNIDLLITLFEQHNPALSQERQLASSEIIDEVHDQNITGTWGRKSWPNLAPQFAARFPTADAAIDAFRDAVGGNEYLVDRFLRTYQSDPKRPPWDDSEPTYIPDGGVATSDWGIAARNPHDRRAYQKHWRDFPVLKHPHDRWELADRLEAEIEKATDQRVTIYVLSVRPWRGIAGGKEQTREELAP